MDQPTFLCERSDGVSTVVDSAEDLGEALGGVLVPRPMDRMRRSSRGRGSAGCCEDSRGGVGGRVGRASRLRLPPACSTMADSCWAVLRGGRDSWMVRRPWGERCVRV
jgi:hypothetical protein